MPVSIAPKCAMLKDRENVEKSVESEYFPPKCAMLKDRDFEEKC